MKNLAIVNLYGDALTILGGRCLSYPSSQQLINLKYSFCIFYSQGSWNEMTSLQQHHSFLDQYFFFLVIPTNAEPAQSSQL